MVRSFNPQGRNSSLETNENFPPQSELYGDSIPAQAFMLFEDSDFMLFENGLFMEYEE